MHLEFLLEEFRKIPDKDAIVWNNRVYSYDSIRGHFENLKKLFVLDYGIKQGNVAALKGDFSPACIAALLALTEMNCIIVPLNFKSQEDLKSKIEISEAEFVIEINAEEKTVVQRTNTKAANNKFEILKSKNHPGLILFSSGTTGIPKAALHDFTLLLEKFKTKRKAFRTINFLMFDHWGGLNTMFGTLSNGGTIISLNDRTPDNVCGMIEKYKAQLLPVSPTFLNLLLISEAYKRYDLNSLEVISYGTEPMPESTLKKLASIFPSVKLQQTYGLIEIGVMSTKSKSNNSLWVKLGGDGFETRVRNNMLEIKSRSSIICYLNYPSQFTNDGWFMTGDEVETDGEYFRILGRKTDLINVGGEKVYPAEVESVIKELEGVAEARVYGESNPITGSIVCVDICVSEEVDKHELKNKIKKHCINKLQRYKVPAKIKFTESIGMTNRFKKKTN
ncbi:MAG: Long-chain-fatty-acid--CoA ligase FadD13 [Ignavibacteria bacterium]|nr:Long-chain-fatty-acid--CoA ligase FadD13 [Ignavibacteria bacterium]